MQLLRRTSLLALAVAVGLSAQVALADGWSLSKLVPFSSSNNTKKSASNQPSMLQKMNNGTKQFFGKVGQTFSPNKPQPKKGYNPYVKQTKKEQSGIGSWFAPKEPEPPRSLQEWMALEPIRP